MSEIKLDKNGKKYEFRKELANLVNQEVEVTLFDIKLVRPGARLQILSQDVELSGKIICRHAWCNLTTSLAKKIGKKRVNVERGQNIKARAKVVEYTNKKGQLNYSFKLYEIL